MFNDSDIDSYPYLKDGVESENYEIRSLPDHYYPLVTYNPEHNFYLIKFFDSFKKLDGDGNEVFSLGQDDSTDLPNFTHYIFTGDGVYNTTVKEIKEERYKEVVNKDRSMKFRDWEKVFKQYYAVAQEVIYGTEYSMKHDEGFAVYFKTGKDWIKLISKKGQTRADDDDALQYSFEGYPAKYSKMIILKDPIKETFSDQEKIDMMLQEKNPENYKLNYTRQKKIKVRHFKKIMPYDHIAYTPIPILWAGTAIYQIKIQDEVLTFKENAIKPFIGFVQNHFHWYILPDQYFHKSEVSFLELKYPSNHNESGSNGMYIIKKKG